MLERMELWLLDQLDYFYGLERLALRAGLSAPDAKRIAWDHRHQFVSTHISVKAD